MSQEGEFFLIFENAAAPAVRPSPSGRLRGSAFAGGKVRFFGKKGFGNREKSGIMPSNSD